jgi:hypothetical protein
MERNPYEYDRAVPWIPQENRLSPLTVVSLIKREEIILDPATPGSHPSPGPAFPEYELPAGIAVR